MLSRLNFFSKMGARARLFVLLGAVVGIIGLIYLGVQYMSGAGSTGPSQVANAPSGLQSVPGGKLTPEYYRALSQANQQAAQQAKISGGSAIPTLINVGGPQPSVSTGSNCNIICSEDQVNVKNTLDDMVKKGNLSPEISTQLQQLADKNVSVDDYAAQLDQLVKEGKITPEQARQLLDQYKKQHANEELKDSAKVMDDLIKSGDLPVDVANQLLAAQKNNISPADYAAQLDELVKQGKISPATAAMLLAQYTQQQAKKIVSKSVASLHELARNGQLTPEVEQALVDLENKMGPVDQYANALNDFVNQGKLIPAIATKILDEYKSQKAAIGPTGSVNKMLQKAEAEAYGEINDLLKAGKMSQEVAVQLTDMIQKDVPLDQYKAVINQLVTSGKMTPDIAKLKVGDYQSVKGLRKMTSVLSTMQGNNVSQQAYADELKRAVLAGELTPEQAAQLMKEYQSLQAATTPNAPPAPAGAGDFAKLQQRLREAAGGGGAGATGGEAPPAAEFEAAQTKAAEEIDQQRQQNIDALAGAMSGQAQQLIASWQPATMSEKVGTPEEKKEATTGAAGAAGSSSASSTTTTTETTTAAPLIKSGTILFAVLDTAVNSDYPDSPVMATIVDGKYKGAKLLGKLATTKGVAGQMDRVTLNFSMMNMEDWPKSKGVTAFAIDPDTARTVLASQVDYHYMQRFGAMMATSFLQGYASAITNAGTSTTGIFGTSTSHPALSPSQKFMTALGQMGQTLGTVTQNYVNIPPTVKVDSGVGLGILFMSDVS